MPNYLCLPIKIIKGIQAGIDRNGGNNMKFRELTANCIVTVLTRPTWGICRVLDKTTNGCVFIEEIRNDGRLIRHFINARWIRQVDIELQEWGL